MSRRDIHHQVVIRALIRDGWTITDDPLRLSYGGRNLYVDVAAERAIGAEKAGRKIAIEIKSFLGESDIHELSQSVGQFVLYREILAELDPSRQLYLAVPLYAYIGISVNPLGNCWYCAKTSSYSCLMTSRRQLNDGFSREISGDPGRSAARVCA